MHSSRRQFLRALGLAIACVPIKSIFAKTAVNTEIIDFDTSNFRYIYGHEEYKTQFYNFLTNVFHLFPEEEMHQLISDASKQHEATRTYIKTYKQMLKAFNLY